MPLALRRGVFNFLFRNKVNVYRRAVGVTASGDTSTTHSLSTENVYCKIAINKEKTGDNVESLSFAANSSHKAFFFKSADVVSSDKIVDANSKEYIVNYVEEYPGGISKFKIAFLSAVEN